MKTTPIIKGVIRPQQNRQNIEVLISNMNSMSSVKFSNPKRNGYIIKLNIRTKPEQREERKK